MRWLERRSALDVLSLALLGLIPVVAIDLRLGPMISLSVLTLAPVFLVACFGGRFAAYVYSVIAGLCWFAADWELMPDGASAGVLAWAIVSRVASFLLMAEVSVLVRKAIKALAVQASTDALTGLANHRELRAQVERALAVARRDSSPISAAFLDCDNFKAINDVHGHAAGDRVLRAVAGVLSKSTRPADIAARVGGDEFVLVMPGTDRQGGRLAVARIQFALNRAMQGLGYNVTFSIGAATFETPPDSVDAMLARIDECQYRAKRSGKDRFVYHGDRKAA